ncbi:MAG: transglutaminase-like domain-containing protein [Lachnospiraceae bacterium]|nr:transglutaminase-like domain-containing protein [Lachnospiraceae bacterium]
MQLGLFKKKKKKKQVITLCQGVTLVEQVSMGDVTPGQDAIVKGLIEVCIVFGSMGGFLSCFDISYYVPVVAIAYILIAAYFSYLFKSGKTWVRDTGYVIFFLIYAAGITVFSKHINSGFYAVLNIIYDSASTYFDMPAVREFNEYFTNRDLTVTVMAVFVGCVEIIILNIYLSTYMSILAAVMISVPLYTVPLFFNQEPDSFYMILLFAGLLSVMILKANGHYTRNKESTQFSYVAKKRRRSFCYSQSGKVIAETILSSVVICVLVICVCNITYPKEEFYYRYKASSVKAKIEDPVENVLLTGFSSLFNFYGSTSGMSGGRLGGVSSVRSDYQPDLVVTFTPYSYETVYLKCFTGEYYDVNHWSKDTDDIFAQPVDGDTKGIMQVKNVGADNKYLYMPYYSSCDEELLSRYQYNRGIEFNMQQEYTFYPYNEKGVRQQQVKDSYLDVPEANVSVIERFCTEAGFHGSDEEMIAQVSQYFQDNITYTLRPGSMPRNGDFVNHFLEKSRKGYCAHFASAAVLIFRYFGIPARYIEGYAVPYTLVMDADLREDLSYDDYFTGESALGRTAVVDVEVTDANAHAWVEVFLDGKWQVAEVTPASDDEEEEDDFWSIFGNLLSGNDAEDTVEGESTGTAFSLDKVRWIWIVILYGILLVLALVLGRFLWKKGRRIGSYHKRDMAGNVIAYYHYMCECMRAVDKEFYQADSHYAQLCKMLAGTKSEERMTEADIRELARTMESISYSNKAAGEGTEALLSRLKTLFRERKQACTLADRVYLFLHI